jgi:SWI/SNF-related matrix-associated actin-dependent regulator of chromatin subfamily A-like protein 1
VTDSTISNSYFLREYEAEAVRFLLSHRRSILGLPPGTGKTPTTLAALEQAAPARTLLVVPKSVCHHWQAEATRWFPGLVVLDGRGTPQERAEARGAVGSHEPTALLITYESFRRDVEALEKLNFSAVVFDEAHRLKSRAAQVTQAARVITRNPSIWLWLLTGTPIPNRPPEAWSLLNLIDRHRWHSYWRWVDRYCEVQLVRYTSGQRFPTRTPTGLKAGAEVAIRGELADVLHHRPFEELLPHLPPATITPVFVDLDDEERRHYDELVKRAWTEVDGTILRVANEVARITRLRQITSDLSNLIPERDRPGSKVAATVELVTDLDEQVVVLTWSRAAAEMVARETGGAFIHGGVSGAERQRILGRFATGEVRVLSGTLSTLGEGVDGMQVARHLVRLDRSWVPSQNEQAIARIRRSGQQHSAVFVWDIIARKTTDSLVAKALASKEDVINALLERIPNSLLGE